MRWNRPSVAWALVLICALPLLPAAAETPAAVPAAGLHWTALGRGVEHADLVHASIHGHAFRFRPADVEMRVIAPADGRAPITAIAPKSDAIATNASFFDEAGKTMGVAVDRGRSIGGRRLARWAAFVIDGGLARIVAGTTLTDDLAHDLVLQGLPRLVVDGAVARLKPQRAERTALCIEEASAGSAHVVLLVTTSRTDASEFAHFLATPADAGGLGCRDALNLDGGSSTQMTARWGAFEAHVDGRWGVPNALVVMPGAR